MFEVNVSCRAIDTFTELVGPERVESVKQLAAVIRGFIGGRAIWNVNSTAVGGGVAEMLRSLLRYARGLEVQVRWVVLEGTPHFFQITKRLHNALHDLPGDGSPLGADETQVYETVLHDNAVALDAVVQPGDVVICHDPQTAGLVPHLVKRGVAVIWRCHIGHDRPGREVDAGWAFLRPYLDHVPLAVFSRASYAPTWLPHKRSVVLPPNIDPFSAKNQPMDDGVIRAILCHVGITASSGPAAPVFLRDDGSVGRVDRKADILQLGPPPPYETPLVVQVSRWDRLKDHAGVMQGFVQLAEAGLTRGAHLVLAGPNARAVADDPEGPLILDEVEKAWHALPDALRELVHLVQLPMADSEENGAIVNALQRHATVIVQKSIREGFGLTVTEALWKCRPVVASAVGGIQDQIRDGIDGLLVRDPDDIAEFARVTGSVLADPELAKRLGSAGYERVRENYLSIAALEHWARLVRLLVDIPESGFVPSPSDAAGLDVPLPVPPPAAPAAPSPAPASAR